MTTPMSNTALERYVCNYENVTRFKGVHVLAAGSAVIVGGLIGLTGYLLLAHGIIPSHFAMSGNIIAAVTAGSIVSSIAIISILIHYGYKIGSKYEESSEDAFFKALIDPSTDRAFEKKPSNWTRIRFQMMLYKEFPDENWIGMMRYLNMRFFKQEGTQFEEKVILRAFNAFCTSQPIRFARLFYTMKSEEMLSPQCIALLEPSILEFYQEKQSEFWIDTILEIDAHYFSKNVSFKGKETRLALLNQIAEIDKSLFAKCMNLLVQRNHLSSEMETMWKYNKPLFTTEEKA